MPTEPDENLTSRPSAERLLDRVKTLERELQQLRTSVDRIGEYFEPKVERIHFDEEPAPDGWQGTDPAPGTRRELILEVIRRQLPGVLAGSRALQVADAIEEALSSDVDDEDPDRAEPAADPDASFPTSPLLQLLFGGGAGFRVASDGAPPARRSESCTCSICNFRRRLESELDDAIKTD